MNSKQKKRIWIISFANIAGIILFLLIFYIFHIAIQRNISVYQDTQKVLADSMLNKTVSKTDEDGNAIIAKIKTYIEECFPTSSSFYCILTKNNKVAFYKDENTTSTLIDDSIDNYFKNSISLKDHKKYILSKTEIKMGSDSYSLIICTKQDYYLKKSNLAETRLYSMSFFFLYGAILSILLILNYYKINAEEKSNQILMNENKKNRQIIELLEEDKNKHYVNSEKEYSFYNRSIVEEVIAHMTQEEIEQCIQIDIWIGNARMEHFIFITAVLGRIKESNSIACYWEENQFKILMFYSNKEEATEFINLFINKYKSESEEKVEELKIIASKLNDSNSITFSTWVNHSQNMRRYG